MIQAIGGGIASAATTSNRTNAASLRDTGNALLTAGVAFQAANMMFCGVFVVLFLYRYRKAKNQKVDDGFTTAYGKLKLEEANDAHARKTVLRFKLFCWALATAYITMFIRCVYRVPEMASGWGSSLMRDEVTFLILDSMMIAISVLVMTVFHPSLFFPYMTEQGRKSSKTATEEEEMIVRQRIVKSLPFPSQIVTRPPSVLVQLDRKALSQPAAIPVEQKRNRNEAQAQESENTVTPPQSKILVQ